MESIALPPDVYIPPSCSEQDRDFYLASKRFPDGRVGWVVPMTLGKGRLIIQADPLSLCYDDCWCYDSREDAISALARWDGSGEPNGWMRHPSSGRRRPGGDASKEYTSL